MPELLRGAEAAGGVAAAPSDLSSSAGRPVAFERAANVPFNRSVSNGPGSRPLMVTLRRTVLRASPATKPVRPARAPFERPRDVDGGLDRGRRDVHHPAELPLHHSVHRRPDELDGGQHVGVEGGVPVFEGPLPEVARGRAARVVDEDVGIGTGREHRRASFRGGDVAGHGAHPGPRCRPDRGRRLLQDRGGARRDPDFHPLRGERVRASSSQALARRRRRSRARPAIPRSIVSFSSSGGCASGRRAGSGRRLPLRTPRRAGRPDLPAGSVRAPAAAGRHGSTAAGWRVAGWRGGGAGEYHLGPSLRGRSPGAGGSRGTRAGPGASTGAPCPPSSRRSPRSRNVPPPAAGRPGSGSARRAAGRMPRASPRPRPRRRRPRGPRGRGAGAC